MIKWFISANTITVNVPALTCINEENTQIIFYSQHYFLTETIPKLIYINASGSRNMVIEKENLLKYI
jgi:hypothetical protein